MTALNVVDDLGSQVSLTLLRGCKIVQPLAANSERQFGTFLTKHTTTVLLSSHILGHLSQRSEDLCSPKYIYVNIYSSFIHYNEKLNTSQTSSVGEWLKKPWYIYTMEYNSAIKKTNLSESPGIILSGKSQ